MSAVIALFSRRVVGWSMQTAMTAQLVTDALVMESSDGVNLTLCCIIPIAADNSCWHMNEHESAAMWKLYSSSNEAVCTRSTYRRLRQCLPKPVMVGEVNYINWETQGFPADKVFTRRGHDWTHRFKKIASDAWHVNAGSAIIDGEVVVPAENGSTDFSVLQNELKGRSHKIVLVAFDLLYLNSYDLRKLPLVERKTLLRKIVADTDIQFSESFEIEGGEMFKHACSIGLEGVVSKVRDSRYQSGRSNDWVKKTCAQRETLPIAGFALKDKKFDGIYVGRRKGKDLVYAGKVDHGFDAAAAKDLQARLEPLIRKTQPYTRKIAHRGVWVEPQLLAEIEYPAKSAEGKVRPHPLSVVTDRELVPSGWLNTLRPRRERFNCQLRLRGRDCCAGVLSGLLRVFYGFWVFRGSKDRDLRSAAIKCRSRRLPSRWLRVRTVRYEACF